LSFSCAASSLRRPAFSSSASSSSVMTLVTVWIATCHDFGSGHSGRLTSHSTTIATQPDEERRAADLEVGGLDEAVERRALVAGLARLLGGTVFFLLHRARAYSASTRRSPAGRPRA